jgi:hypothetical protein
MKPQWSDERGGTDRLRYEIKIEIWRRRFREDGTEIWSAFDLLLVPSRWRIPVYTNTLQIWILEG